MAFNANLPADNSKLRLSAAYIRNNFQALQAALGENLTGFVSGTKLWFYQDTAPLGWSIVSSAQDCVLSCKVQNSSSASTYQTGGQMLGTWQQSATTLSVDQMPSHSHYIPNLSYANTNFGTGGNFVTAYDGRNTDATGGSQPHDHGNTWRPLAAVGILCTKN